MKKLIALSLLPGLVSAAVSCSAGRESSIVMNEAKYAEDGRQILNVASFGSLGTKFTAYTQFPLEFQIELKNYMPDGTTYEEASRQLDMDMIQGNSPDILFAPSDKMYNYIRKGAMADLYPLMEEYGGVTKDDFLPNVLEGLTVDGELPAVVDSFFIQTAVAKKRFVGEEYENWTPEQAMQFYESLPEGRDFIDSADEQLAEYMLINIAKECIDIENNTCNFSDSNFVDVLRFCAEHPVKEKYIPDFESWSEEDREAFFSDEATRGLRDAQLIFPFTINGINNSLAHDAYANLNLEEATFVGLPSNDGNGGIFPSNRAPVPYGILKSCGDKENAWKFLSEYLKYRKPLEKYASDGTRGVPSLKSQFDVDFNRSEEYNDSINRKVYLPWAGAGRSENDTAYLPQEYKDKLRDYIFSVKLDFYFPNELMNIVREEYEPVLAGERTPEQAAKILDNRISTYLSERA